MNKPYIGVTDFTTHEQVLEVRQYIPEGRRLHVGAMISYKTLHGIPTSKGWEKIWLKDRELKMLFARHPKVFNVIHYADYDDKTTLVDLTMVLQAAGSDVEAIQLDMKWPVPSLLSDLKAIAPHIKIIQQIGHTAILESGTTWDRDLAAYEGIADYVLMDCGMGKGIPFSVSHMLELVRVASLYFDEDQIAVAGGLGPDTYMNLQPIIQKYPKISCDAQGRLRASGSAVDPLDMDRVIAYVKGVASLVK